MERRYSFFLILGGLFAILSCQNNSVTSEDEPSPVRFVTKSSENQWVEQGIDAIPEANAIFIEWLLPDDPEINKYEIYRGNNEEDDFILINTVEDTFYIDDIGQDENVELNDRCFYYVLAVNYDGARSVSSDTIDYKLMEKPARLLPNGTIHEKIPTFEWEDMNQANDYIIRVKQADNDQPIWLAMVQANFGSDRQQVFFNNDGSACVTELDEGTVYQWRVDVIGPESNCGSESKWNSFIIQ